MDQRTPCWVVEDGELRHCDPAALGGCRSWVALHTHSCYSTENIASLNWVVRLWYMRPFAGILQWAFGLAKGEALDYRDVTYHPPLTPNELRLMELAKARALALPGLIFSVTDHDEVAGGVQLAAQHPELAQQLAVGVELSVPFKEHLFHLGVTGLPAATAAAELASLQRSCRSGDLEAVFERLRRLECLVVLNHPLLPWRSDVCPEEHAQELLARFGPAIDALEFNGMRTFDENLRVVALAKRAGKPVVGGGDSHLLAPGAAGCATRAETFAGFVREVRAGRTTTIVTADYFSALGWKLSLRVLSFVSQYRAIADFRGKPVAAILDGRWVALDPVGRLADWFLKAAARLGRVS